MTDHGWIFGLATTKAKLLQIAQNVSKLNGVIKTHIITGKYNIMIEFRFEEDALYKDFRGLLNALEAQGIHNIETWFGMESYP